MPADVPPAPAHAAPAAARDGFWTDRSLHSDVQLLVVGGRVVAARGTVDQQPASSGSPAICDRAAFAFVGPVGVAGNRSTRTRFHFDMDSTPWFSISGRVVSASRITGTLTKRAGGHGDLCAGSIRFSVSPA